LATNVERTFFLVLGSDRPVSPSSKTSFIVFVPERVKILAHGFFEVIAGDFFSIASDCERQIEFGVAHVLCVFVIERNARRRDG
jgi:hypothetical protein